MPPPKGPTRSEKLLLIHRHLRHSGTCFTLKELEKLLPSIAFINSILVKDFIKELVDENKLKVEKIGTGNWYWCFGDEEAARKIGERERLKSGVEVGRGRVGELERRVEEGKRVKGEREQEVGYAEICEMAKELEEEVAGLRERKEALESTVAEGVEGMKVQIEKAKLEAGLWTDNIYVLEGYMKETLGVDREMLAEFQRELYAGDYVEGEGLRELEGL